jgi:mycothiol synthase
VSLPAGFTIRPAVDGDAEPVAALMNEESEALVGFRAASLDWLLGWWTAPSVARGDDLAVVETPEREVCGFIGVAADPPYVEVFVLGVVALRLHGRGIGSELVCEGERRAGRFVRLAAPEARVLAHYGALAGEPRVSSLLARHGYREVRRFQLMRVDFAGALTPPGWPQGISVRTFDPAQIDDLYRAHIEAFADHWGEGVERKDDFRHQVLASPRFDPALWFLAWSGAEVAGYVGAKLEADEDPARGYVSLLGVRKAFRGRGLGEALLRQAFRELAARGKRGCDLHVDSDSITGATRLYERVGMRAHPRFATWEKELRAGGRAGPAPS